MEEAFNQIFPPEIFDQLYFRHKYLVEIFPPKVFRRNMSLLPRRIFNLGGRTKSLLEMARAISGIYESERGVILPIKELSATNKHVSDLDFRSLAFQKIG
mgnify:CR=1 FL=1